MLQWLLPLKWFWQRGRRGWADDDLCDFDMYLFRVISEAVPALMRIQLGHPCFGNLPTACKNCTCHATWNAAIQRMVELFHKLYEDDWQGDKWWEDAEAVYREAMALLTEHARSLWV